MTLREIAAADVKIKSLKLFQITTINIIFTSLPDEVALFAQKRHFY